MEFERSCKFYNWADGCASCKFGREVCKGVDCTGFAPLAMGFNDYQEYVCDLAVYPNKGSNYIYPALGIGGEAGECCDRIKKAQRDDGGVITDETKALMKKELGDLMWYIAAEAMELEMTLEEIVRTNINKLRDRRERDVLRGSGDNR